MNLMIDGKNLRFGWDESNPIIDITRLEVERGASLLVRGKSGRGKTTLLSLLSGLYPLDSGTLVMNGISVHELAAAERDAFRANELGVIFQQFNLLPFLSVLENIQLPTLFRSSNNEIGQPEVLSLLTKLNLSEKYLNEKAQHLSVGEQQRVAIARALAHKPPILLADEPTSALDDENRASFFSALRALCEEQQSTLVMVTHDARFDEHFDDVLVLA